MLLEICANSFESARQAQLGGADRIELCAALELGGLTPSAATIQLCRRYLTIDIFVLLRPRSGDFCYSENELLLMEEEIEYCKSAGVDGLAFGVLQTDGQVDVAACRRLVKKAAPLQTTFHRAFDKVADPLFALEQLIELGFDRVLSSGQQADAPAGSLLLRQMVKHARGRIEILAGGGINEHNVKELIEKSGIGAIHCSTRVLQHSKYSSLSDKVKFSPEGLPEDDYYLTDAGKVQRLKAIISQLGGA